MIEEEFSRILKENQILLKKMIDIDRRPSKHSVRNPIPLLQSLNLGVTKKRYQEINSENFVLLIIIQ